MSAFDPKRQLPNPALRPRARIATFLDFSWPFAQSQVALNGYFAEIQHSANLSQTQFGSWRLLLRVRLNPKYALPKPAIMRRQVDMPLATCVSTSIDPPCCLRLTS
jgi:hypothetical protein